MFLNGIEMNKDMNDETKEKMRSMGRDLQAVCQDRTHTMKKRSVIVQWKWLWKDDEHEESEQSLFITYYEFDSLNDAKINDQRLIVDKKLSPEEWGQFR